MNRPMRPSQKRKPFGAWAPWGIPLRKVDRRIACEELRDRFLENYGTPQAAMQHMLQKNAEAVSRCGTLTNFASILMAISLYIAVNPKLMPAVWQKTGFHIVTIIWITCIVRMLSSLVQVMPASDEYSIDEEFLHTADLYLWRMTRYNFALVASEFCFIALLVLLAPISTSIIDAIFSA